MTPPLSIADTITILRAKYPDALICTACGLLLATQRASYAKSNPTEEQRLAYVCAECRQEQAEAERIAQARREALALARAVQAEKRAARADMANYPAPMSKASADPHEQRGSGGGFLSRPSRKPSDQGRHGAKGGRPRKHASDLIARKEARRAYRARQRQRHVMERTGAGYETVNDARVPRDGADDDGY